MFFIVTRWHGARLPAGERDAMLFANGYPAEPVGVFAYTDAEAAKAYSTNTRIIMNREAGRRGYGPDWLIRVQDCA